MFLSVEQLLSEGICILVLFCRKPSYIQVELAKICHNLLIAQLLPHHSCQH